VSREGEEPQSAEDLAAKLISVTEAAEISNLTTRYIRRLIKEERIWGVKIGRNWLTTEKAIRDFLQTDRRPGRPRSQT
jgi:excisionase family DNA binding protein